MSGLTIKEYFALAGSRFKNDDARAIGPVLQELASSGDVTPAAIVQAAHSTNSPLHSYFEWDDRKAAGIYREGQASEMIQAVRVRFVSDGKEYATRAYNVVTRASNNLPREITVETGALPHPIEQIAAALRELDAWRIKYVHLQAMRRAGEIITPVINQISEFRSDFVETNTDVPPDIGTALTSLKQWAAEFSSTMPGGELVAEHMGYMVEAIDDAWSRYCAVKADKFAKDKILESENEELRERIFQLEELLNPSDAMPTELHLTRTEESLVSILLNHDLMTKEKAMVALYSIRADTAPDQKIIDVLVCKIRPKLEPIGVKIETHWGRGWFMDAASKEELRGYIEATKARAA